MPYVAPLRRLAQAGLVAALTAAALACGSSESSSFTCCLNGRYYDCRTQEEMNTCALDKDVKCARDARRDGSCAK